MKIATVNPQFLANTPNPGFADNNIAANSMYDRSDKDRQFGAQQDQRESEKEIKAMEAMLKNPQQAQAIAQSYGVQITPEIEDMLTQPQVAQQMSEALKLAKDAGLDRYQSIQEFVTGYMQSGGDPMQAMEAVTDKSSLKEVYYNTIANRPGRGGTSNPFGPGRVQQPDGSVIDYTKGIVYDTKGGAKHITGPNGKPIIPPKAGNSLADVLGDGGAAPEAGGDLDGTQQPELSPEALEALVKKHTGKSIQMLQLERDRAAGGVQTPAPDIASPPEGLLQHETQPYVPDDYDYGD
jgi:hypothetical protein